MFHDAVIFRIHALHRMFERDISATDVRDVLENGRVVEHYPHDLPHPARLMLGWCDGQPIHIVVSYDPENRVTVVVTVYEPDPLRWDASYTHRR